MVLTTLADVSFNPKARAAARQDWLLSIASRSWVSLQLRLSPVAFMEKQ